MPDSIEQAIALLKDTQKLVTEAIQKLEGNLSHSQIQAIRANSASDADYLQNLQAEYQASNEAIANLRGQTSD